MSINEDDDDDDDDLVVRGAVELAGDAAAFLRARRRHALERLAHVVRMRGRVELHVAVRLLVLLALVQAHALRRPLDEVDLLRRVALERRRRLERLGVRLARRQLARRLLAAQRSKLASTEPTTAVRNTPHRYGNSHATWDHSRRTRHSRL